MFALFGTPVHFVDLFFASETIAAEIEKGINFMLMYANNCDKELHLHRCMQILFAKQPYWKSPYFPTPLRFHPSQSKLLTFPSPASIALCFLFFIISPFASLLSPLIPLQPFSHLASPSNRAALPSLTQNPNSHPSSSLASLL